MFSILIKFSMYLQRVWFCRCGATVKRAWSAERYGCPSLGPGWGPAAPLLVTLTEPLSPALWKLRHPHLYCPHWGASLPGWGGAAKMPGVGVAGGWALVEMQMRDGSLLSTLASLSAALICLCCSYSCLALWLHRKVWGSPCTPQGAAQTDRVPAFPTEPAARGD